MKKVIIPSLCIAVMAILSSCEKQVNDCNLVAAKIIRYDCDRVIFQVLANEIVGDADWTDVQTGQHYTNVVSYYNTCAIASKTNGQLDTLYVGIRKTNDRLWDSDCNQCHAISDNPPQTKVDFAEIAVAPCDNNNPTKR
jgi:hypothetical protein